MQTLLRPLLVPASEGTAASKQCKAPERRKKDQDNGLKNASLNSPKQDTSFSGSFLRRKRHAHATLLKSPFRMASMLGSIFVTLPML